MQRGRVKLPQSKMSLLIIRISALALLVGFVSAHFTCRQDIQSGLMRDLWKHTRVLISRLPKENHFSRRFRLLPNFCVRCQERAIGWLELRELIDIYQRSVFSSEVIQELLHPHYNDLMYGLQHTLQRCVSSSEPSKYSKILKKLEKRIKKTRKEEGDKGDEGVLKAVREFTYILRWINELRHHPAL